MAERPASVETAYPPAIAGGYRPGGRDLVTLVAYVALAVVVLRPLWTGGEHAVLARSAHGQTLTEWAFSRAAHHGGSGLDVLFAPLTLAFGPTISLVGALAVGLTGTAYAWYWLLTRKVLPVGDAPPTGRLPAALAGGLIGFSPALVGHAAAARPSMVVQILVPFILWRMTTLWHRPVRNGLGLGLLVAAQAFVGAGLLPTVVTAGALFLAVRAVRRPVSPWIVIRRYAVGAAVAAAVAGCPLWMNVGGLGPIAPDRSMLPVVVCAAVWTWRRSVVSRAVTVTAAVLTPLIVFAHPGRFAMVATVCAALLLALALHRLHGWTRWAVPVVVVVALLPLAPTPLQVRDRPPVPDLITTGQWTKYVRPGRTLVVAPRPDGHYADPVRWQYVAGFGFRLNDGREPRRSEQLVLAAFRSGVPVSVSPDDRAAADVDLRAWGADAVVVDPRLPHAEAVRATVTDLYGVSEQTVGGLWVWDVRGAIEAPPT